MSMSHPEDLGQRFKKTRTHISQAASWTLLVARNCHVHLNLALPSHCDHEVDTCRVCWQGGATCPQPGDLDVDTTQVALLLQDLHCCLSG